MTEDEAKTKWCPWARTLDSESDTARVGGEPMLVGAAVNRVPGDYDKYGNEIVQLSGRHRCIGSACMAWRPHYEMELVDRSTEERRPAYEGIPYDRRHERLTAKINGGYCGLAGKP